MNRATLENNFKYHAPNKEQSEEYVVLRDMAKGLAIRIDDRCPEGREKSLAFTKLEECIMWANAAIARAGLKP